MICSSTRETTNFKFLQTHCISTSLLADSQTFFSPSGYALTDHLSHTEKQKKRKGERQEKRHSNSWCEIGSTFATLLRFRAIPLSCSFSSQAACTTVFVTLRIFFFPERDFFLSSPLQEPCCFFWQPTSNSRKIRLSGFSGFTEFHPTRTSRY